jgi:hypothetical protein
MSYIMANKRALAPHIDSIRGNPNRPTFQPPEPIVKTPRMEFFSFLKRKKAMVSMIAEIPVAKRGIKNNRKFKSM